MASDLVGQLREFACGDSHPDYYADDLMKAGELMKVAADEIERLRGIIENVRLATGDASMEVFEFEESVNDATPASAV